MNIKEQLDQYQIGGIGDIKRKTLRFHSYRMGTEGGKLTLFQARIPGISTVFNINSTKTKLIEINR